MNLKQKFSIGAAVFVVVLVVALALTSKRAEPTNTAISPVAPQTETTPETEMEVLANPPEEAPALEAAPVAPTGTVTPKAPAPTTSTGTKTGTDLKLYATPKDEGITFTWTVGTNVTNKYGYKLVRSTLAEPLYPRDVNQTIASPAARSFMWDLHFGETYNYRLCAWNGVIGGKDGCFAYSNVVKVTANNTSSPNPAFIPNNLGFSGRRENDGVRLFWSSSVFSTFQSYQVVRSETDADPFYPKAATVGTITDRATNSFLDTTVQYGKSYYYRICVLVQDSPVSCSNTIQLSF
ncbi:MAG: hypothetical protein V1821_01910 [bacterium]